MGKWLIVRHGETEWNRNGCIQGQADTPLSDEGRAQAAALAATLRDVQIDRAFSSDLSRARETAMIVIGDRKTPVLTTGDLRELNFGRWEGRLTAELAVQEPELFTAWHTGNPDFAAPEGESVREMAARIEKFVAERKEGMLAGTSLIVAHGGSVRCLLCVMLGIPLAAVGRFNVARASLSVLEVEPAGSVLMLYNDVSHYRRHF